MIFIRLFIVATVLAAGSQTTFAAKHGAKDIKLVCPQDCAAYFESPESDSYDLDDIYRTCFQGTKEPVRLTAECERAVKSKD